MTARPPLIVCAELDPATTELLDGLRRQHFPPGRTVVGAHLTLFHHLDGPEPETGSLLAEVAGATPALDAEVAAPRNLGRGVAFAVTCPPLLEVRQWLAARAPGELTPQDRQWRWPHVTVANKLDPPAARALQAALAARWERRPALGEGLSLWRYLGGPWEPAGSWPFTGPSAAGAGVAG